MKIFKFICVLLLLACTVCTGYYAWIYQAALSTGVFLSCTGMLLFVVSDGGLDKNRNR